MYNQDICSDSGCASYGLKVNVLSLLVVLFLSVAHSIKPVVVPPLLVAFPVFFNLIVNRQLLSLFYNTGGPVFFLSATLYYMFVYAAAVGYGGIAGILSFSTTRKERFANTKLIWRHGDNQP